MTSINALATLLGAVFNIFCRHGGIALPLLCMTCRLLEVFKENTSEWLPQLQKVQMFNGLLFRNNQCGFPYRVSSTCCQASGN